MGSSSYLLPAVVVFTLLCGLHARIDVYSAFVRGAREGLKTLLEMTPYLCAAMTAVSLLRETGVLPAVQAWLASPLGALGMPPEAVGVALLRPLSGSAALAAVREVIGQCGADSRAARIACVISGAGETMLFTGALYQGAAGRRRAGCALGAAIAAYCAGVAAACLIFP